MVKRITNQGTENRTKAMEPVDLKDWQLEKVTGSAGAGTDGSSTATRQTRDSELSMEDVKNIHGAFAPCWLDVSGRF